ncbi:sigma-70 family RNA polymerase sigma factor family protein [Jatrophihabitans fulvus]
MPGREDELAAHYDDARDHLVRVAYAVLGSRAEAEDVVADCWLRLVEADRREPVRDVTAWGTVAVARAALDVLRSARKRREVYPGEWLPEPVLAPLSSQSVEDRITLDETVRYAVLVVLESLSPAERVSFVLHDVFGMGFGDIGSLVGRSPAAARQLASRARSHVAARAPRFEVERREHDRVFTAFLDAASGGDLAGLLAVLDPAVVLTADGGGVVTAARRPVIGADRVGRFVLGTIRKVSGRSEIRRTLVNGELGLAILDEGEVRTVVAVTTSGGRIARLDFVRAPDKLRAAQRQLAP